MLARTVIAFTAILVAAAPNALAFPNHLEFAAIIARDNHWHTHGARQLDLGNPVRSPLVLMLSFFHRDLLTNAHIRQDAGM